MPVSVLQGDPLQIKTSAQTINGSAGRTIALNNIVWWSLLSSTATIVTTATAGNRTFVAQLLDAAGNILVKTTNSLVQSASNTWFYDLGSGIAVFAANSTLAWPTPYPTLLPPVSSIQVLDQANIDVNDTIAWNLFFGT